MPLANEIFEGRHRAVQLRVREILALDSILSVTVYDRDGEPLAHLDRFGETAPGLTGPPPTTVPRTRPERWHGLRSLAFEAPVSAMGDPIGFVRIQYSLAGAERYKRLSLLALAVLLFTTLLVMIFILNRLLTIGVRRPIEGLRSAMVRVETEGPGVVVDIGSNDEIGDLTRSFNAMSRQLADLLEKRRVEVHRRKKAQEMLDSIIRSIPDILYRLDPAGKITFINDAVSRYGYRPDDLIGKDIITIVHPEDRPAVERRLKQRRNGKHKTRDLTLRLLNNAHDNSRTGRTDKPSIMLVDAEGLYEGERPSPDTFKGTQGIARDITRLKDLEHRLRQAQKMEAIGALAGGIAHDFNNILGGIIGHAELALRCLKNGADPDRLRTDIEGVITSGIRAADLVKQILQFARRGETAFAPVDIGPVLKETLKLVSVTLPKTIAVEVSFRTDASTILGDPTQIHQVLMNLCTNAFQAMRDTGGTLSVSMEEVTLREERRCAAATLRPGRYVRIEIADTGAGISREVKERIFEPYFTTKKMGEGTGLGLSVSMGIVENHGGAIDVESMPGSGTVFSVFLPLTDPVAPPKKRGTRQLPKGEGERILLVDDDLFLLNAICKHLAALGYRVRKHHSSTEALAELQGDASAFDLLITDQTMPRITGIQLIGKVRRLRPDLPVLLCTGYSETVTEETASQFGISKFLMKPFSRETLAWAVHQALNEPAE
jgi:signal transduction histidine kinase/CheY-like chemotaxis protein/HAMP domain-containing protein